MGSPLLLHGLFVSTVFLAHLVLAIHSFQRHCQVHVSVEDFGAKGDGVSDDTKAFIDGWRIVCSAQVTAMLEIPARRVYLVGPVNFTGPCRSKVTLLIKGKIVAPSNPDLWDGLDTRKWLYFRGMQQLVIRGGGTIDGMGQEWWDRSCKINPTNACAYGQFLINKSKVLGAWHNCIYVSIYRKMMQAITFHRSKQLTVQELSLVNSQQMHMAFTVCSEVKVSRVKVTAPADSPNTDGIHISSSISVTVEDSTIRTGDDCISVVSNSSIIRIQKIQCGPGHGISIGSLGKSKELDQVQDLTVDGASISNTENGVRIKTWQGGSGYARDIVFRNIVMKNVSNPIIIDQYYCDSKRPCRNQTAAVKVDNVSYINIKGTSATEEAVRFACSDNFPCEKIYMEDVKLSLESGGTPTAFCWQASGFSSGYVYPPSCLSAYDYLVRWNLISSS